jgi:transposase-like protein
MRTIKQMELMGYEWGEGYRRSCRTWIVNHLESRMKNYIDLHLQKIADQGEDDRRNGYFRRHLLTELGDIELRVARTRRVSATGVVKAYARRPAHIDRMILACFVLGLSTRKVAKALLPVLGEPISAATVSRVAKSLDHAVAAFHRRRLKDCYKVLVLDGVVLSRKTGAGALKRPVLVALGIHKDGRKEIIDFRLAPGESSQAWERFLTNLYRRGLEGKELKMICVDGGSGLNAALPLVYDEIPVQRCWAHKSRNILNHVKKKDHDAVKGYVRRIYLAKNIVKARQAAGRFVKRWSVLYPGAVSCLQKDLDDLLSFFVFKDTQWRKATRTTNAIERRFVEVRRRTRPMGVFSDRTSMDRILYAVFTHENSNQGTGAPFPLTQNS